MNELKLIQESIEKYYELPKDHIWQNTRQREVVLYRHLFFYLRSKIQPQLTHSFVTKYTIEKGCKKKHDSQIHSKKVIENLMFWNTDNMANNVAILLENLDHLRDISFKKNNCIKKINERIHYLQNELKKSKQKKRDLITRN